MQKTAEATPEERFAELFENMYELCIENEWGDPFSYARSREIHMANILGHRVAPTLSGADAYEDNETGKKKPVYRWNYEDLTEDIYQAHLEGKLSIGIQPCNENSEVKFGVIDIDPKDYADFNKKDYIDIIQQYELPLLPVESKSGGLHLFLFFKCG